MQGCGGGFAEILRLMSQLFWHSLSHIRRFSSLRMTKLGDARRSLDDRLAHGACRPLIGNDRGGAGSEGSEGSEGSKGSKGSKGDGAAHFVILSGEKRRVLKNGLSENMRTESKDLSAAKYKNSLPQ